MDTQSLNYIMFSLSTKYEYDYYGAGIMFHPSHFRGKTTQPLAKVLVYSTTLKLKVLLSKIIGGCSAPYPSSGEH